MPMVEFLMPFGIDGNYAGCLVDTDLVAAVVAVNAASCQLVLRKTRNTITVVGTMPEVRARLGRRGEPSAVNALKEKLIAAVELQEKYAREHTEESQRCGLPAESQAFLRGQASARMAFVEHVRSVLSEARDAQ